MHTDPPAAPIMSSGLRPRLSMRKNSQKNVMTVLITPKIPVIKKVVSPSTPRDLKTVGL